MEIYAKLKEFGKVKTNEPLSKHTTFKIGGPADFLVSVDETATFVELLKYLDGAGHPYFILGGGSNMLVSNEGFHGVVIKITDIRYQITNNNIIEVAAGCSTVEIAQASMKAGLTGFEWGVGVPGTIGGAVRGNAGAMGGEMKDVVEKVEVYRDGEIVELSNEKCEFGYRDSIFKHNSDVILRAWLRLEKSENKELAKKAIEHLQYRNKTQPQGWASTGCIFKNVQILNNKFQTNFKSQFPNNQKAEEFLEKGIISAGWLVEQVGMKGKKVGNAQVSEEHGNFIINLGGATAKDVLSLIDQVKQAVYDRYGIAMEEEIQIIGF